jgi:hypothetical protein
MNNNLSLRRRKSYVEMEHNVLDYWRRYSRRGTYTEKAPTIKK